MICLRPQSGSSVPFDIQTLYRLCFSQSYSCAVSLFYVHTTTWPRLRRISRVDRSERFEHVSEYVLLMGKVDYHDSFIVTKWVTHVASCILRWRVVCMKDYPDNRKDCDESLSGALCCRTALFAITIGLVICTRFKAKYIIILPQGERFSRWHHRL